jgi:hypothetical protein
MRSSLAFRIAVGVQLSEANYIKRNTCVPNATLRGHDIKMLIEIYIRGNASVIISEWAIIEGRRSGLLTEILFCCV